MKNVRHARPCHFFAIAGWAVICAAAGGCGNGGLFQDGVLALPAISGATCERPPNGCGPAGILGAIVPECPSPSACFTSACDTHDLCYRECGIAKSDCDNRFTADMQAICAASFDDGDPLLDQCNTFAFIYGAAVELFGNEAFLFTQLLGCACEQQPAARRLDLDACPDPLAQGPPFEDADGDLMPDDWERTVGLNPQDPGDAMEDADGDGFTNIVEFLYSADPLDPTTPQ